MKIAGKGILITWENRDELKSFYNQIEDINKSFTVGYYMGYDIYEKRFAFSNNKNTFTHGIVTTLEEFNVIETEQKPLDYWQRVERVKELAAMDNKPWCDVNPSY